eukprot:TRINITY_DN10935_c0_g1_i1.p1 TRINITY_DN10935_c0_g1~~TRINITY_DN10935_c0_g1_i1.p1  ORF type:complete len:282 (-),score=12.72 TRINITY_DN10935_c0_g1_i1:123-968(-)
MVWIALSFDLLSEIAKHLHFFDHLACYSTCTLWRGFFRRFLVGRKLTFSVNSEHSLRKRISPKHFYLPYGSGTALSIFRTLGDIYLMEDNLFSFHAKCRSIWNHNACLASEISNIPSPLRESLSRTVYNVEDQKVIVKGTTIVAVLHPSRSGVFGADWTSSSRQRNVDHVHNRAGIFVNGILTIFHCVEGKKLTKYVVTPIKGQRKDLWCLYGETAVVSLNENDSGKQLALVNVRDGSILRQIGYHYSEVKNIWADYDVIATWLLGSNTLTVTNIQSKEVR